MKTSICCLGPGFFVTAAFILSQVASKTCKFFDVPSDYSNIIDGTAVGIFCYTAPNTGNEWGYPTMPEGSTLLTVQRISIACTAIGFCAWIFTLFSCFFFCCKKILHFLYVFTGLMLLANVALESCNFLLLNSQLCANSSCVLGTGAKCSISAAVLWFVASIFTCGRGKQVKEELEEKRRTQDDDDKNENEDKNENAEDQA